MILKHVQTSKWLNPRARLGHPMTYQGLSLRGGRGRSLGAKSQIFPGHLARGKQSKCKKHGAFGVPTLG